MVAFQASCTPLELWMFVGEPHRTLEREKKRAMDALRDLDEELRIARQESADAKKQVGDDEARCT